MEHEFAIILKRAKRIVGFAKTYQMATAAINAIDAPFRRNYEIVPYCVNRVVANER